ncbi:MAG: enoyl-CoA hydratase/isomerase family protein [Thermoanaerobaculia bacterium]
MSAPIRCAVERSGQLQRILLDRPKGNVLDLEMLAALRARLSEIAADPGPVKLLVFEGAGEHFSFGASVDEHLPGPVARLLPEFHGLFRDLEALSTPTAALVRGQCLGGAFELALWCGVIFCEPSARFGVPEVRLGVFPPIAAIAMPWRVSGARATQLILSGDSYDAQGAVEWGLVDRCANDAETVLQEWFVERLADKSAVAVRAAWRAARRPLARALAADLPELERLYLEDLMAHRDPVEGLTAFLERRRPVWSDA